MKHLSRRLPSLVVTLLGILILISGRLPWRSPALFGSERQIEALGLLLAIIGLLLLRGTRAR